MPRLRYVVPGTFVAFGLAALAALDHMNAIPAMVLTAPGYLVQMRLYEIGRAPGGWGYRAVVAGGSALVWTLVVLAIAVALRYRGRRAAVSRPPTPPPPAG